jgi:CRP-like cAMP-binding protein/NAD-dependent dihydropyrimidine dehydrogenase PreA subunit
VPGAPAWRCARPLLVAGYLAFVVASFASPLAPRVFWTMLLPLLVLFVVLAGFHPWRALCPLAAIGALGPRLAGEARRRVPEWLERGHFVLPFTILAALLVLRLVATNGDGRWLAGLLVALALAAVAVNARYSGKSWCNFFCPVGVVERIYTDPRSLRPTRNSQCVRCTACKKSCPDIDQENNYWRELVAPGRRFATYAFPGLVLAFYAYFWLRAGDWEAYFDGRWTRQPVTRELLLGPGFHFAPGVPAVAAAALTLVLFAVASWALFRTLDAATRGLVADAERHRHLLLALAAFAAFSLFYLFAGAPTLRKIPYGTRAFAFVAPAVAVLVLARRWGRSRSAYLREKGAAKLVRNWPFAGEPPADPIEAYARAQASTQAREQLVAGYAQTLRDVVADGLVDEQEVRLLDEIRRQLGITPREHEQVVARLGEAERRLLAGERVISVEERVQLESYGAALTEALLRGAAEREIEALRRSFGVGAEAHAALRARLRGGSGPLVERARRELAAERERRADREALAATETAASESGELLAFLLARAEEAARERVADLLALVGEGATIDDLEERPRSPVATGGATGVPLVERLTRLAGDADPFLRAAAVWHLAATGGQEAAALSAAGSDPDPLVREAATAGGRVASYAGRARIAKMQFLRRVPIFADLDPDDLLDLAELAVEEEVAPGSVICVQGVPDRGDLFVVLAGRAAVTVRDGTTERRIAELGTGEVVGELALLDGSARSADVRALEPLRVLRIPAPEFRERLLPRGRVARALLLTLTGRLRALTARSPTRRSGPGRRSTRRASPGRRRLSRAPAARLRRASSAAAPPSRASSSSWRTVPTRHGTHWPHDSSRKNAAMRRSDVREVHVSSKTSTTPEPSVAPRPASPSNVSGIVERVGATNTPAAPPSRMAWIGPPAGTPPASSSSSPSVVPKGTS